MAKTALGRGLGALLGGSAATGKPATPTDPASTHPPGAGPPDSGEQVARVPLSRIRPCPFQPRKEFDQESLRELADSIKEQGIVQPLIVRPQGDTYELIAGERRWRAARIAGLEEVPVIVREADNREVLELALIENLQRENLNPIEEAHGFAQLIEQFALKQDEAAAKVGKSRAAVANALRLLRLSTDLQAHVRDGRLSVGHAKVILGLEDADSQALAADRVIRAGLSVRQTEELVSNLQTRSKPGSAETRDTKTAPTRDSHVADLENRIQERLGTRVQLRYRQGKGAVEIRFFNDDDLQRILEIIGVPMD